MQVNSTERKGLEVKRDMFAAFIHRWNSALEEHHDTPLYDESFVSRAQVNLYCFLLCGAGIDYSC